MASSIPLSSSTPPWQIVSDASLASHLPNPAEEQYKLYITELVRKQAQIKFEQNPPDVNEQRFYESLPKAHLQGLQAIKQPEAAGRASAGIAPVGGLPILGSPWPGTAANSTVNPEPDFDFFGKRVVNPAVQDPDSEGLPRSKRRIS